MSWQGGLQRTSGVPGRTSCCFAVGQRRGAALLRRQQAAAGRPPSGCPRTAASGSAAAAAQPLQREAQGQPAAAQQLQQQGATRGEASKAGGGGGARSAVVGVVLVDHGSRRAESNAMLDEFAALYRWVAYGGGRGVLLPGPFPVAASSCCSHRYRPASGGLAGCWDGLAPSVLAQRGQVGSRPAR